MNSRSSIRVLAGDIGGTKTRLAVMDVEGNGLRPLLEKTYSSREHASLRAIVQDFSGQHEYRVEAACFGIAGPVRDNVAKATNLPWRIDARELAEYFNIGPVTLINDLEANAWGIPALKAEDVFELHEGDSTASGNAAIIAAGTGLGEAGMYFDGQQLRPFATEGGHADFSPCGELEIELLRFLLEKHRHVSWERILAGSGLVNIHEFLRKHRKMATPKWLVEEMATSDPAAAISRAAQEQTDRGCEEALEMFVRLYGAEAGNLALKHMATGGVFIGGGIAPKILAWMRKGGFMHAFLDKGRMRPLLETMPVRVILNERTALYGPAIYAAQSIDKTI
ncbi:glucokinase [Thiolapillus brandeum]|uniref:Glucokinase n=1 Tax=Thiolapillus brandeum TaxID=1076588 RepID=A0A7U6JH23_9GAMM|nr:glucokinase [Thiolapillus brandeum]BAO43328.1 glucokinase [Thiolapillus brandeum]